MSGKKLPKIFPGISIEEGLKLRDYITDTMIDASPTTIAESEIKLREAVLELKLDTPLIRDFLTRTAKEYMRAFGLKGRITKLYVSNFIFVIQGRNWGPRRVRVPVTDFFKGKSDVAQRDLLLSKLIKKQSTVNQNNISLDTIFRGISTNEPDKRVKRSTTKKKKH